MRLRGKGIPDINGRGRGDILVVVDIDVPSKLSVEERKTVEQLAQSPSFGTPDNSRPEQKYIRAYAEFLQIRSIFVSVTAAFVHFRFRQRILERYGRALL